MQGYKKLLSYKLSKIAFDLTWELAPFIYPAYEDSRQRSQLKQAARSLKHPEVEQSSLQGSPVPSFALVLGQNNVEGSEERSLSSKLKLWDVARSSGGELIEDCEDFMRQHNLPRWDKDDSRLVRLRASLEGYRSSHRSVSPGSSVTSGTPPSRVTVADVLQVVGGTRSTGGTRLTKEELETVLNYLLDVLIRCGYLLDKQINAIEKKHQTEGGYTEQLYRKRKEYRGY